MCVYWHRHTGVHTYAQINLGSERGADSAEYSTYKRNIDLRTSGINVGLAVDLEWKHGITFDVNLQEKDNKGYPSKNWRIGYTEGTEGWN